eukprot:7935337-Pyramimonas_sp.AAC.1
MCIRDRRKNVPGHSGGAARRRQALPHGSVCANRARQVRPTKHEPTARVEREHSRGARKVCALREKTSEKTLNP